MMMAKTYHSADASPPDPCAAVIRRLDQGFMHLYRDAHRITRLAVALLPLMALLVGSCKTAGEPQAYNVISGPEQFRAMLFPDRAGFQGANYLPAAGYVSAARGFVEDTPPALMMLTQQEIGYLYGKPALQRQDADAEVWQYKTGACVVDFYFYGRDKLSYVDVRLKEDDMTFRAAPPSVRERSRCLRDVDAEDFAGTSA